LRQPKDDGCGDADGGHEGVGAAVIAGVDAAPVLELAEHVLDLVTLAVECCVVRDGHLSVGLGWDAGGDAALGQCVAEPVGIVAPVGQQGLGLGERIDHQRSALVIAHLPFAQQHDQRTTLAIADSMELGVQAALGPPDTSG
jgi:hypothetical protein